PINTSGLSADPTNAVTLIDPADDTSQTNGIVVSESSYSQHVYSSTGVGSGGNGTGGNGTGGSTNGGSGGNGNKPSGGHTGNNNNNSGSGGNTDGLETLPDSAVKPNGLSKRTIIALAVSIPILFLLLCVGLFFMYRNYKRAKADRKWTPGNSNIRNNMRVIMEEIGGTSDPLNLPGPKDDLNNHRALVFVLLVLHTASGIPQQSNRYVERASFGDWPAITSYRGAILVKNGRQTSCEFALIDQKSAFIAASCLDLNSGTMTVNDNTRHEIFFDNGKGANVTSSRILTANVHIHPDFDPASYANNIAIVVYTIDQKRTWTNAISVNRDEWTNALFVRRYMESEKSKSWRSPMINSGAWGGLPGCDTASGIYAANQRDFLCSTESSSVTTVGACKYPYSSVYGVVSPKMAIAALHSHTVVQGDAMCGAKQTFHYYTVLAGYVGFAQKVLGYDIKYFTISGDFSSSIDASYKMQPPAFGIPKGLRLFGGDVFIPGPGVAGTDEAPLPVPSPPPSPDAPSAAPDAPAPDAPAPN
ncbi:hypothetical protein FBU31_005806, partial [Coemansia sp. 'formosensis']